MSRPDIQIVRARPEHAAALASVIRQQDLEELFRLGVTDPAREIQRCIERSVLALAGFVDEELIACWGVCRWSILTGMGMPWAISGVGVERWPKLYMIGSRYMLREIRGYCPHLVVMIDDQYPEAKRWAKWLGFELSEPMPWGPLQQPFVRAEMNGQATEN